MNWRRLFKRLVMDGVHEATKQGRRALQKRSKAAPTTVRPSPGDLQEPKPSKQSHQPETPAPGGPYPGDFTGRIEPVYDPHVDGVPDPGEIVWTWVPYEEDHSQGKDRPVLLIGRDGDWLIGLQVTSKDHDVDAAQEARAGRYWVDIGSVAHLRCASIGSCASTPTRCAGSVRFSIASVSTRWPRASRAGRSPS